MSLPIVQQTPNLEITGILVIRDKHLDKVALKTKLPGQLWPYTGTATPRMDLKSGSSEEYFTKYFPNVPIEIINIER